MIKRVSTRIARKNLRNLLRDAQPFQVPPPFEDGSPLKTVGYRHTLPEPGPFAPPPDYVHLPLEDATAAERKGAPIVTGCLDYFPDALLEVAMLSKIGNDQHNPGEPLHWARGKSGDEADTAVRHLMGRGTRDKDGVRHSIKVAWRALANAQKEIEAERADGKISRGSRL